MTNHSSLTIKADLIIRVPALTNELPYMQNSGRRIYTTSRIGKNPRRHQYNEYSPNEKVDISKYSAEVLQLPYLLHRLCNHK